MLSTAQSSTLSSTIITAPHLLKATSHPCLSSISQTVHIAAFQQEVFKDPDDNRLPVNWICSKNSIFLWGDLLEISLSKLGDTVSKHPSTFVPVKEILESGTDIVAQFSGSNCVLTFTYHPDLLHLSQTTQASFTLHPKDKVTSVCVALFENSPYKPYLSIFPDGHHFTKLQTTRKRSHSAGSSHRHFGSWLQEHAPKCVRSRRRSSTF